MNGSRARTALMLKIPQRTHIEKEATRQGSAEVSLHARIDLSRCQMLT